ncbi:MAG: N-acetylmannosamine-6-phosphate 2-epimerase [Anaerolineae bacterium]
MLKKEEFVEQVRSGLIVSCQALSNEPLHSSEIMARMALAAAQGGAVGIRANSPEDIRAIRNIISLPIIGIYKEGDTGVFITPTFSHAQAVVEAGADIVALDATQRPRPDGKTVTELIARIHSELKCPVMADISTLEEAHAAEAAGADFVAPTLAGYTPYSQQLPGPDVELLRSMIATLNVPVIAEGHITTPEDARLALVCGALAVVVGSAITRPQLITARFVDYIRDLHSVD